MVTVEWHPSSDPDPNDSLYYRVYWADNPEFTDANTGTTPDTTFLISELGLFLLNGGKDNRSVGKGGAGGLILDLPDDTTLYWKIEAVDMFDSTAWCIPEEGWSFNIYISESPDSFNLVSPVEADTSWDLSVELIWQISEDPDPGDSVLYQVHYDTLADLSTAVVIDDIPDTTFVLSSLLDDHRYFWTIKAVDTNTDGTWANDTLSFYTYLPEAP